MGDGWESGTYTLFLPLDINSMPLDPLNKNRAIDQIFNNLPCHSGSRIDEHDLKVGRSRLFHKLGGRCSLMKNVLTQPFKSGLGGWGLWCPCQMQVMHYYMWIIVVPQAGSRPFGF